MSVSITAERFSPWSLVADLERQLVDRKGDVGACVTFVGTMRDFNEGDDVAAMELEYYQGMTERVLQEIIDDAKVEYDLVEAHIHHRVGEILPGEAIVVIVVWSAHRREAFAAARQLIEFLKARAPFWKREMLPDGNTRWVTHNTPG